MKFGRIFKTVSGYVWRLPLCAFAYMAGTMAGGALVPALGMKLPPVPEQADEKTMGLYLLIGSFGLPRPQHTHRSGNLYEHWWDASDGSVFDTPLPDVCLCYGVVVQAGG